MNWAFLGFVAFAAAAFAKLEIHIEGAHGWAANLPTWKIEGHPLLQLLFGGRPLTGYHVWAFVTVFIFFHAPFFWTQSWSPLGEANVFGAYVLFWILEDFLWFVLNPHFGVRRFRRENIWWHKRWFAGVPLDYWLFGVPAAVALFAV